MWATSVVQSHCHCIVYCQVLRAALCIDYIQDHHHSPTIPGWPHTKASWHDYSGQYLMAEWEIPSTSQIAIVAPRLRGSAARSSFCKDPAMTTEMYSFLGIPFAVGIEMLHVL
jgi:hypothetical protein